jgi:hypothetical protein
LADTINAAASNYTLAANTAVLAFVIAAASGFRLVANVTAAGANTFSGVNTFSGNNTHSGANTFSGNNTFSANNTFSGSNIYNVVSKKTSNYTVTTNDFNKILYAETGSGSVQFTLPENATSGARLWVFKTSGSNTASVGAHGRRFNLPPGCLWCLPPSPGRM